MARRWAALGLLLAFLVVLALAGLCAPDAAADHKPGHPLPPGHATRTALAALSPSATRRVASATPTPTASASRASTMPATPSATDFPSVVPSRTRLVFPTPETTPSASSTPTPTGTPTPARLFLPYGPDNSVP